MDLTSVSDCGARGRQVLLVLRLLPISTICEIGQDRKIEGQGPGKGASQRACSSQVGSCLPSTSVSGTKRRATLAHGLRHRAPAWHQLIHTAQGGKEPSP